MQNRENSNSRFAKERCWSDKGDEDEVLFLSFACKEISIGLTADSFWTVSAVKGDWTARFMLELDESDHRENLHRKSFYYRKSLRDEKEMRQDSQKELGFINLHVWEVLCFVVIVLF